MNLSEIIYLIIKPDGTYYFIQRNNKYMNHYQYLTELSKQDDYLKKCSFGLTFEKDNNIPNILFFKELILDNCILMENYKILSSENVSAINFYLPEHISMWQDKFLNSYITEIDEIKNIFLEKYSEETGDFYCICQNLEEIKSGSRILKKYIQEHLYNERNIGK